MHRAPGLPPTAGNFREVWWAAGGSAQENLNVNTALPGSSPSLAATDCDLPKAHVPLFTRPARPHSHGPATLVCFPRLSTLVCNSDGALLCVSGRLCFSWGCWHGLSLPGLLA